MNRRFELSSPRLRRALQIDRFVLSLLENVHIGALLHLGNRCLRNPQKTSKVSLRDRGPQDGYGIVQALRTNSGEVLRVETGSLQTCPN